MAKDKQKAQSERSALRMAKPPDLCDMLRGSMSPAPTSEPPTPAPDSRSDDDMDAADVEDSNPTINIPVAPTSTPPVPPASSVTMEGANADAFMANFDDPESFYASGAKDKVLADLQAAMRSTHNLTETLNLWLHQGYRLDADATRATTGCLHSL
jgi:hypothetical protein